ncbi:putative Alcohol dehydrogenase transcription factor Myb/SANT-like-containing protein 3 [Homarus americanus]|uniref:Putative Alcohol dehydrogenase transcription factor Myb/SANT-like-containing protein 3 n=1 Tax=Homarus americanus TaxID=6706 RepID=A0A8J5JXI8_HOMAM|nr:putative Alcohol dehydrogenase transcription factor Myb/SANT-like-containing protein 3 [Homarus americanus]
MHIYSNVYSQKPFPPDESSQVKSSHVASCHVKSHMGFAPFSSSVTPSPQVDVQINLVRERPAIYDPTDRSHRDRDVIAALCKEVAAVLKCKGATTAVILKNF